MKNAFPYAVKSIGVLLFLWFLSQIDRTKLLETASQASLLHIALALLLFPVIYSVKSFRWYRLTQAAGLKLTYAFAAQMYCASLFLGIITPGKMGEAIKIPILTAQNLSMKKSILLTIADRMLDIICLGILALFGLSTLHIIPISLRVFTLLAIGILLVAIPLFSLAQKYEYLKEAVNLFKKHSVEITFLTLLNWSIYFVQLYLLATALSIRIPVVEFISIMTVTGIVSLLPIAPAGLGTREATLLIFFSPLGIAPHVSLAYSYLIFIVTIVSATCIGGICWLRLPLLKKKI